MVQKNDNWLVHNQREVQFWLERFQPAKPNKMASVRSVSRGGVLSIDMAAFVSPTGVELIRTKSWTHLFEKNVKSSTSALVPTGRRPRHAPRFGGAQSCPTLERGCSSQIGGALRSRGACDPVSSLLGRMGVGTPLNGTSALVLETSLRQP
jgi:hypothetical protein